MEKEALLKRIFEAIVDLDKDALLEMVDEIIKEDMDINEVINSTMSPAMEEVGRQFQEGVKFLPELQLSADVFQSAMDILTPKLIEQTGSARARGRVVIGTVKGDLHSIGKDLVATMLKTNGFEVQDLGIDVPASAFLEEAEKKQARVIALSALLSTTLPAQRDVIEVLKEKGLRDKYKVLIGGAPADAEWAKEIGADAYGEDAAEAVTQVRTLCE